MPGQSVAEQLRADYCQVRMIVNEKLALHHFLIAAIPLIQPRQMADFMGSSNPRSFRPNDFGQPSHHGSSKAQNSSPGSNRRCRLYRVFWSATLPVTAIFVAVLVFDADLHAPPSSIIVVTSIVSVALRAIPALIVSVVAISVSTAILVPIAIFVAVTPPHFRTNVAVVPAHAVAVASAHAPVATHLPLSSPLDWLRSVR